MCWGGRAEDKQNDQDQEAGWAWSFSFMYPILYLTDGGVWKRKMAVYRNPLNLKVWQGFGRTRMRGHANYYYEKLAKANRS